MQLETTRVFQEIWKNPDRINVVRGGSRSSKSYSLMQIAVMWLMTGYVGNTYLPEGNFSIVRATFPALRKTVLRDFTSFLHRNGLYKLVDHKKSIHEFWYQQRHVDFFSTDDADKLKGQQHTLCWINEADSCTFEDFIQMVMRLENYCFIDCNPSNSDSWVKQDIEDKRTETHEM